jgi:predicted Fe-Mo cluster-binding NifX family protein
MNISRPTFQRVLYSARRKIADALLNGRAIRIEGGNFEPVTNHTEIESSTRLDEKERLNGRENMKIAIVTDDGKTISQHFGRARYYLVVTVEDSRVVNKEQRPKAGHHGEHAHESHASAGARHGFDTQAQATHAGMMANVADCQLVIAGGMGWGAQASLKQAGIDVFMTDKIDIDEAINLYLQGKLVNLTDRLH